jgi:hypothetical protein
MSKYIIYLQRSLGLEKVSSDNQEKNGISDVKKAYRG